MTKVTRQSKPRPLCEALPQFTRELEELLAKTKRPDLAAQISELTIVRRCRCEDDFCASFYTQFEPNTRPFPDCICVELEPMNGMIILDIVSRHIAEVEVLYRDDVRTALRAAFP